MPLLPPHYKTTVWTILGMPFGGLYGIAAWGHRAMYVYGPLKRVSFEPLLICIGNLSVGGTGKTPHVLYLQHLLGGAEQTAMISRGYGRKTKGVQWVKVDSCPKDVGDEPLQFKCTYPRATVLVAEKRAAGIQQALAQNPNIKKILLDDAMQHWGVQADCTLLLTTFNAPFFQQQVLPFGRLREFRSGYKRADVIIVTKCPKNINATTKAAYKKAIAPLAHQHVLFSWLEYQAPYELLSGKKTLELEQPLSIFLLTAIANPQPLKDYLAGHHLTHQKFPDHYLFTKKDLQQIAHTAQGKIILTTEKDATKLRWLLQQHPEIDLTIYVLPIRVAMSSTDSTWLKNYFYNQHHLKG